MRYFNLLLITFMLFACKEPQARKPVSVKTGTFLQGSAERTKKRLEQEHHFIQEYIKQDSANTYLSSNNGFWYTYIKQDSLTTPLPKYGDEITFTYSVSDIKNNTIYSLKDIGEQTLFIDQESEIIEGFRQGLKLLKKGEEIKFIFPSQLAYGYRGDGNKIKINTPIVCTTVLQNIIINKQ